MSIHFSQATHLQKFGNFHNAFRKRFRTGGKVAAASPNYGIEMNNSPALIFALHCRGAIVPRETPMRYPAPASPLPDRLRVRDGSSPALPRLKNTQTSGTQTMFSMGNPSIALKLLLPTHRYLKIFKPI